MAVAWTGYEKTRLRGARGDCGGVEEKERIVGEEGKGI